MDTFKDFSDEFKKAGVEVRLVGGAVRDIYRDVKPKDYDIAINASFIDIKNILNHLTQTKIEIRDYWHKPQEYTVPKCKVLTENVDTGTIKIQYLVVNDKRESCRKDEYIEFDLSMTRKDLYDKDSRFYKCEFTDSWEEDSKRRDFTINSMYMDASGALYDYNNGIRDLLNKQLKFIVSEKDNIDVETRLEEDHIRALRYWRFISQFGTDWVDICQVGDINDFTYIIETTLNVSNRNAKDEIIKLVTAPYYVDILMHEYYNECVNRIFEKL